MQMRLKTQGTCKLAFGCTDDKQGLTGEFHYYVALFHSCRAYSCETAKLWAGNIGSITKEEFLFFLFSHFSMRAADNTTF